MKRALLTFATASVLALGAIGAAGAADLIVKAPVVAPVPAFSWTGIYLGIGGGAGPGVRKNTAGIRMRLRLRLFNNLIPIFKLLMSVSPPLARS